jgi:hypothetical protein
LQTALKIEMLSDNERIIKTCLMSGGLQVVNAMREVFCETQRPANELDAAYIHGRNSVILELYQLIGTKED